MGDFEPTDFRDADSRDTDSRDIVSPREAQDHDKAGGINAPSPRPEADDGQWSQDPENYDDEYETPTQPMQGWYAEEDVIRFGAAVRDMMREPYPARQMQQGQDQKQARGNR